MPKWLSLPVSMSPAVPGCSSVHISMDTCEQLQVDVGKPQCSLVTSQTEDSDTVCEFKCRRCGGWTVWRQQCATQMCLPEPEARTTRAQAKPRPQEAHISGKRNRPEELGLLFPTGKDLGQPEEEKASVVGPLQGSKPEHIPRGTL